MVRLAQTGDLPRIFEVYAVARELMRKSGNPTQWGESYPPHEMLRLDIPAGQLYVVERQGVIHGVFALTHGADPSYGTIDGAWRRSDEYGTLHRLGSDGSGGVYAEAIAFCRERCPYLRADTHRDNRVMQHILERDGFRPSGIIHMWDDGTPRIAYEWFEGIE